jgi:hypothetical protein
MALLMSDPVYKCAICGGPVSLEKAKSDENGQCVHEECLTAKVRQSQPLRKAI